MALERFSCIVCSQNVFFPLKKGGGYSWTSIYQERERERERERDIHDEDEDWDQVQYLETRERKRYTRWWLRSSVIPKVLHIMQL